MAENLTINKSHSTAEIYEQLLPQLEALIDPDIPVISNLSNIAAGLFNAFDKISWCGFYMKSGEVLYLGPFCGNVACTTIKIGKGVCGTSAASRETIIVEDVDKFPGHIACDAGSKSEIVVPLFSGSELFGVLDLDSYEYSSFNETDKIFLEKLVSVLINKLDFVQFKLL
ncbi:MAG: hypothetical protein SCALA702_17840 [Melioribacteraceae bacterium]|nr:MAG: hypothetical protein SCALA702_17840 [Melioribacteraceae bacterium]